MDNITSKRKWKDILLEIGCFDIYHTYDYHKVCSDIDQLAPAMFVERSEKGIVAMPLLERSIDGERFDATSVYGYPGPISNILNVHEFLDVYKSLLKSIYNKYKYVSIFSRANSFVLSNDHLSSIGRNSGETVFIDLNCSEEEQLRQYRSNHKRDISKLKRSGFECKFVKPEQGIGSFIEVYESTMHSLGASNDYFFSRSYYEGLFDNSMAEVKLVECLQGGSVACCGIFFFCNNIVQYHVGGTSAEFYKFAPTKLMFDFVRQYAFQNGYDFFHLGGGLNGSEDNLLNFKKGFSNRTSAFFTIREVLDEETYDNLSKYKHRSNYFPLYRSPC